MFSVGFSMTVMFSESPSGVFRPRNKQALSVHCVDYGIAVFVTVYSELLRISKRNTLGEHKSVNFNVLLGIVSASEQPESVIINAVRTAMVSILISLIFLLLFTIKADITPAISKAPPKTAKSGMYQLP